MTSSDRKANPNDELIKASLFREELSGMVNFFTVQPIPYIYKTKKYQPNQAFYEIYSGEIVLRSKNGRISEVPKDIQASFIQLLKDQEAQDNDAIQVMADKYDPKIEITYNRNSTLKGIKCTVLCLPSFIMDFDYMILGTRVKPHVDPNNRMVAEVFNDVKQDGLERAISNNACRTFKEFRYRKYTFTVESNFANHLKMIRQRFDEYTSRGCFTLPDTQVAPPAPSPFTTPNSTVIQANNGNDKGDAKATGQPLAQSNDVNTTDKPLVQNIGTPTTNLTSAPSVSVVPSLSSVVSGTPPQTNKTTESNTPRPGHSS